MLDSQVAAFYFDCMLDVAVVVLIEKHGTITNPLTNPPFRNTIVTLPLLVLQSAGYSEGPKKREHVFSDVSLLRVVFMPLVAHEAKLGSQSSHCSTAVEESHFPDRHEPIDKGCEKTRDWLAVLVKSHFERYVSLSIQSKGIEEFLPTYVRKGFGQNSHTQVREPLFPGYLFCKPATHERVSVLKIPGIVSFVGAGKQPFPVEEEEIAAIRKMVECPVPICLWPYTRTGQRVRIEKGPLAGIEGIVVSTKGSWRVVVSITLLQRSVAAEVELNSLSCI